MSGWGHINMGEMYSYKSTPLSRCVHISIDLICSSVVTPISCIRILRTLPYITWRPSASDWSPALLNRHLPPFHTWCVLFHCVHSNRTRDVDQETRTASSGRLGVSSAATSCEDLGGAHPHTITTTHTTCTCMC